MITIKSNQDLEFTLSNIYFDPTEDAVWEVYTDEHSSFVPNEVSGKHRVVNFKVSSDILAQMCSGVVKVRCTYSTPDDVYEDGTQDVVKRITTNYYLNNIEIDNLTHLSIPTLIQDSFIFNEKYVDILKYIEPLDTVRVTYTNTTQLNVGEYVCVATAHDGFDFGRGVKSVELTYTITPQSVAIPNEISVNFDQQYHTIQSTSAYIVRGEFQTIGVHNAEVELRNENYVWSDGTNDVKYVRVTIVEDYYRKSEIDQKVQALETMDSNIQATHEADKKAQNAVNATLKKDIEDNKADIENKLAQAEQELNDTIDTTKSELNETIDRTKSDINDTIDTFKEQQEEKDNQIVQTILDTQTDIENKLEQTKSDLNDTIDTTKSNLNETITQNKQAQDNQNEQFTTQFKQVNSDLCKINGQTVEVGYGKINKIEVTEVNGLFSGDEFLDILKEWYITRDSNDLNLRAPAMFLRFDRNNKRPNDADDQFINIMNICVPDVESVKIYVNVTKNKIESLISDNKTDIEGKLAQTTSELNNNLNDFKREQSQTNEELNQAIADNKEELEGKITQAQSTLNDKIDQTETLLNERINDTNDDLNALETATSNNFDATNKEISDNKKDIESKLEKTKSDLTATITQNKEYQDEENRKFVQQLTTIGNDYAKKTDLLWSNIVGAPTTWDWSNITNKPNLFSGDYNDLTNKPEIPTIDLYDLGVGSLIKFRTTDLQLNDTITVKYGAVYLRMETPNGDFVTTFMYSQRGVQEYFELQTRDALKPYVKTDDLNTTLGNYTPTNSLLQILEGYVTANALSNTLTDYAKKTDIPKEQNLSEYVKKNEIGSYIPTDYVTKEEVGDLIPTDYVKKDELDELIPTDYVKKDELDELIPSDIVTETELNTKLEQYQKKVEFNDTTYVTSSDHSVRNIVTMTEDEYNLLDNTDPNTFYVLI